MSILEFIFLTTLIILAWITAYLYMTKKPSLPDDTDDKKYRSLPRCTCGAKARWVYTKSGTWFVECSNPKHAESSMGGATKHVSYGDWCAETVGYGVTEWDEVDIPKRTTQ